MTSQKTAAKETILMPDEGKNFGDSLVLDIRG